VSDVAIEVRGLGKLYQLGVTSGSYGTLGDAIARLLRWRSEKQPGDGGSEELWALRDVSFDVKHGEILGVIGRNGAGKSTLLKILSRIVEPTVGRAVIDGRVGSLLEVGTGFSPELTGRENVYLNGAILGMSRNEIRRRFDEIVAFAEVERFLDTAVKHYSSGMYMRLAFAVAAHLDPEVLIVDEVLAVGDAGFQRKCLGKMGTVASEGRTVLFVSHQLDMIRALCHRCLLLEQGRVGASGPPEDVIAGYLRAVETKRGAVFEVPPDESLSLQVLGGRLLDSAGQPRVRFDVFEPIYVEIDYVVRRPVHGQLVNFELKRNGAPLFLSFDTDTAPERLELRAQGTYTSRIAIPTPLLNPATYTVSTNTGLASVSAYQRLTDVLAFDVELLSKPSAFLSFGANRPGQIATMLEWATYQREPDRGGPAS
jgi:lipopolysaccharide transport system ATP-binding protein